MCATSIYRLNGGQPTLLYTKRGTRKTRERLKQSWRTTYPTTRPWHSLARAGVKAPKSSHITPILRSLHCLKINEHIDYKLLSLTYKVLTTTQPSYLHNLITVQHPRSTRSSSLVTLARPSTSSSLRIIDRSFQYASSRLWNQPPAPLRQPHTNLSNSASPSSLSGISSISSIDSPLSSSITPSLQA